MKQRTHFIILMLACCLALPFSSWCQIKKDLLCTGTWQQKLAANILWKFEADSSFTALFLLIQQKPSGMINIGLAGIIVKQGRFETDDTGMIIRATIDSTLSVYSKDSVVITKDTVVQDWRVISFTKSKIVLSRPPIWEFEKYHHANEKNITVTLMRGKRKRK